jgi:fucose 4-O-acetylase-like acetyltransferase
MQTSMPASPPLPEPPRGVLATAARTEWVDVAKGMGILIVVIGHSMGGLLSARLFAPDSGWATAFYLIYTFHMPLFFVLAGLFVRQRVAGDADAFVRSAFTRIAWPYLLWSVIQMAVIGALGSAVNAPTEFGAWRVVALLWQPTSQFWFLQALLVLHLVSRFLLPRVGALALLGLMLLARVVGECIELPALLETPARFGLFYALGVWAGPTLLRVVGSVSRPRVFLFSRPLPLAISSPAAAVWVVVAIPAYLGGLGYWSPVTLPASVAGSVVVLALATLPRGAASVPWVELGRASMAIFVMHVLFVAGTRIVLVKGLGLAVAPVLIFVLALAAGIVGPLLLRALAARAGATRLFGLG